MRRWSASRRSARWRRHRAYVDTPAADTVSRSMHLDTVPMMPMASPTAAHTQTVKTTPLLPMYHGPAARLSAPRRGCSDASPTDCAGSCGWLRPAGPRRGCRTPCARPTAGSPPLRRGAVRFQPPGYLPASSRSVIEPDHAARTMSTRRDGALRHSGPSTGVRPVAWLSAGPLVSESASLPALQPARVPQASPGKSVS